MGMELQIGENSIVVLGQEYSPSGLNPDFLRSSGIVKPDWELEDQPVTTPVASQVTFANGISVVLELGRLQIRDSLPPNDLIESEVPNIALRYIKHLAFNRHKAVGINFVGFLEHSNAQKLILDRFVHSISWDNEHLKSAGIAYQYELSDATLRYRIDSGKFQAAGDTRPQQGLLVNGNFHLDIPSGLSIEQTGEQVEETISRFEKRYEYFISMTKALFESEG